MDKTLRIPTQVFNNAMRRSRSLPVGIYRRGHELISSGRQDPDTNWDFFIRELIQSLSLEHPVAPNLVRPGVEWEETFLDKLRVQDRSAKYQLSSMTMAWQSNRLTIIDMQGIEDDLVPTLARHCYGVIAVLERPEPKFAKVVRKMQQCGVHWLGYWYMPSLSVSHSSKRVA